MVEGYVIQMQPDDDSLATAFWGGAGLTEDLNTTVFFEDLTAVRQAAGNLQNQYTNYAVLIAPAMRGISLKSAQPTRTNGVDSSSEPAAATV